MAIQQPPEKPTQIGGPDLFIPSSVVTKRFEEDEVLFDIDTKGFPLTTNLDFRINSSRQAIFSVPEGFSSPSPIFGTDQPVSGTLYHHYNDIFDLT